MTQDESPQTTEGPGEPAREGVGAPSGDGPDVHTSPEEGHPAGDGERSDRDIGGPTDPDDASGDATGGAPGSSPDSGFESHGEADSDEDIAPLDDGA
jgi:hypothetical protein